MSDPTSYSTTVANGGPFLVSMEHENLCIISIPTESIPTFAWWLFREYSLDQRKKTSFNSILMEDDGLSIICSTSSTANLECIGTGLNISPQKWRAFVIKVVGSAVEFPGAVHYLADSLSKEGLSILHISTFESEVFLVQEKDIEKACSVFRKSDGPRELASLIQEAQRKRTLSGNSLSSSAQVSADPVQNQSIDNQETPVDSFFIADHSETVSSIVPYMDGFELCVLPGNVMLARLNDDFPLAECSAILTKLLLYDERYSPLERLVSKGVPLPKSYLTSSKGSSSTLGECLSNMSLSRSRSDSNIDLLDITNQVENENQNNNQNQNQNHTQTQNIEDEQRKREKERERPLGDFNTFIWGLWQCENELTFLLDENDVDSFPEGALTLSPQRWRLIKLVGRRIEFDETGIVSAMSKIDSSIPSLNISTATTNCTLVPEELLEQTLDCLSESLGCPVRPY